MKENSVSLMQQREIEARMAAALIRGFSAKLGEEKAMETAGQVIRELAQEAGKKVADALGGNSLTHLARVVREIWSQEKALKIDFLEETPEVLRFNVTHCRYAEQYQKLGLRAFGFCLSCNRDGTFAQGFNPAIQMKRMQTIMEGAPFCDFCFSLKDEPKPDDLA